MGKAGGEQGCRVKAAGKGEAEVEQSCRAGEGRGRARLQGRGRQEEGRAAGQGEGRAAQQEEGREGPAFFPQLSGLPQAYRIRTRVPWKSRLLQGARLSMAPSLAGPDLEGREPRNGSPGREASKEDRDMP